MFKLQSFVSELLRSLSTAGFLEDNFSHFSNLTNEAKDLVFRGAIIIRLSVLTQKVIDLMISGFVC